MTDPSERMKSSDLESRTREWNATAACAYWPDQREHWAPVSWKDHLFDFNVFYNGHVLADPVGIGLNPNILPEQAVFASELRVVIGTSDPLAGGAPDADPTGRPGGADQMLVLLQNPDGRQVASWADGSAPVYRLDHNVLGTPLIVRQSQFAHLPGGRRTQLGDEPLFLWMRFELLDMIEQINRAERVYITLSVLRPSTLTGMGAFNNINFNFGYGVPAYPLPLAFDGAGTPDEPGYVRHAHPPFAPHAGAYRAGLRNRLAVPGGRAEDTTVRFAKSAFFAAQNAYLSHVTLSFPARKGARVDVLYPCLKRSDDERS
jgi:hypothetical protein